MNQWSRSAPQPSPAGAGSCGLAIGAVGRAVDAHVEMIVVPPIGPHLVQPGAVAAGLAAQRLLDRGVDEDALDLRVLARPP